MIALNVNLNEAIKETNLILAGRSKAQNVFSFILITFLVNSMFLVLLHLAVVESSLVLVKDSAIANWLSTRWGSLTNREALLLEFLIVMISSFVVTYLIWKLDYGAPRFDPKSDAYSPLREELSRVPTWDLTANNFFNGQAEITCRIAMTVDVGSKKLFIDFEIFDQMSVKSLAKDVSLRLHDEGMITMIFLIDSMVQVNATHITPVSPAEQFKYFFRIEGHQKDPQKPPYFSGSWYRLSEASTSHKFEARGTCTLEPATG
jgi:hypothetical protein